MKKDKKTRKKKSSINMYVWMQRHKKAFAGTICILIVLGMLVGLLQV